MSITTKLLCEKMNPKLLEKIKVAFSCSWGSSSSQLLSYLKRQTPGSMGVWNNLIGIDNIEDCDVVVSLGKRHLPYVNKPMIQMRREPSIVELFEIDERASYVLNYENDGYHASTWQFISINFDQLKSLEYYEKPKAMSGITSSKWRHRVDFFNEIERLLPEIDRFGTKYGNLHPDFKDQALFDYRYSIAIENSSQSNYFSEKICDCFLSWSKPMYWGCPNVKDFLPEGSYVQIDLNDSESLREYLKKPLSSSDIESMREARNLVMHKYNIWPTIENIVKNKL